VISDRRERGEGDRLGESKGGGDEVGTGAGLGLIVS